VKERAKWNKRRNCRQIRCNLLCFSSSKTYERTLHLYMSFLPRR
jgi:hypothetical protein